jgi:hypothetical protein
VVTQGILNGTEGGSLTLKKNVNYKSLKKKVAKKIFGSNKDKVSEQFRILHNKELHDLDMLPSIVRLLKSTSNWEAEKKRGLISGKKVVRMGGWMELTQDRVQWRALVLAVLNLRVLLPQC